MHALTSEPYVSRPSTDFLYREETGHLHTVQALVNFGSCVWARDWSLTANEAGEGRVFVGGWGVGWGEIVRDSCVYAASDTPCWVLKPLVR